VMTERIDIREVLAQHCEASAHWRTEKAAEYPEDQRNLAAAEALGMLATYIRRLPPNDERMLILESLRPAHLEDTMMLGGEETQRLVERYGFDRAADDPKGFLDDLVDAVTRDEAEWAQEWDEGGEA
jgi:hypothetical protein